MTEYKNILLINFGGIGDEILFLPTIASLKKNYPDAKITLCLEPRSKSIKDLTTLIDNLLLIDIKGKNKYTELLKLYWNALKGNFDIVISSGSNKLIPVLLFFTGIKTRIGYNSGELSKLLLTKAIDLNQNQYAAKMYHSLIESLISTEYQNPKIEVEETDIIPNSVIVHPGVSKMSITKNIIKNWENINWAILIEELIKKGKKVYLAGGPDDKDCIELIRNYLKEKGITNYTDLYGKTKNIKDLAKFIKSCETLICSDSAPMHIGIATDTKTIAIFGPTDEKKLIPASNKFLAITNNSDCRPCLWDKRQTSCERLDCLKLNVKQITDLL